MRYLFLVLGLLFPLVNWGQANSETIRNSKVQPILLKLNNSKSHQQGNSPSAPLKETSVKIAEEDDSHYIGSKESTNSIYLREEYWLNTYQNERNANLANDGIIDLNEQNSLNSIIETSQKEIGASFTWNYLKLRENRNNNNALVFFSKASKLNSASSLLPAEAAWLAERTGDIQLRNKAIKACVTNGTITPFQQEFSKWTIESMPVGSLIITNGEFDTYPLWEQQSRKQVFIISLAMIEDWEWLQKVIHAWDPQIHIAGKGEQALFDALLASEKTVFVSWTLRSDLLNKYKADLYPVGPICRLTAKNYGNFSELKRFYQNPVLQNSIQSTSWHRDPFALLSVNLIPGLKILLKAEGLNSKERKEFEKLLSTLELANSTNKQR
jgi:hypothetical protein